MPPISNRKRRMILTRLSRVIKNSYLQSAQSSVESDHGILDYQHQHFDSPTTTSMSIDMPSEAAEFVHVDVRPSRRNKRRHSSISDHVERSEVHDTSERRSKSPSICSSTDTASIVQFPGKKLSSLFCCLPQCHVSASSKKLGGQPYELFPLPKLKSARLKWALYVAEIDRFANKHSIENCRVCELHFVDRRPTARNPFPTQNLFGSTHNGADPYVRAVKDIDSLNGSTAGRRNSQKSLISDSPKITEPEVPAKTLKATVAVLRPPSTADEKKTGIAFNTRSSRSSTSKYQTSTPIQAAPAPAAEMSTTRSTVSSVARSTDHLVDRRSVEKRLLNAGIECDLTAPPFQTNGKSTTNSKKHIVKVSKLPDGNLKLTSVSRPYVSVTTKSPSLSRVTLTRPDTTTYSDAQPGFSNTDATNSLAIARDTPQTTDFVSALVSDTLKQDECQKPCKHCGDRLVEIKKDLKRLEEKFDSMLTIFSTFVSTKTPLEAQHTVNVATKNRLPPSAPKASALLASCTSLLAKPLNTSSQSGTPSSAVNGLITKSAPFTQPKRAVTTIVVNNFNTRQKSLVQSSSDKAVASEFLKPKGMPQLQQPDVAIPLPDRKSRLRIPDEIMPILFPETFNDGSVSTSKKQPVETLAQNDEKLNEVCKNNAPEKNKEKRTISDDDPELIIECEMEVDENFIGNSTSKDKTSNMENSGKDLDDENIGPLVIDENDNESGRMNTNEKEIACEGPPIPEPVPQSVVNQAVVRAALLFPGRGLSVDHLKTCGPSWLGGIPNNEIDEALKHLVKIGLIESIGRREFHEVPPQYDIRDADGQSGKIEAFRKHLPDDQREKTLLDCGVHLSAFLQAYNRKPTPKTRQLNEFCNS